MPTIVQGSSNVRPSSAAASSAFLLPLLLTTASCMATGTVSGEDPPFEPNDGKLDCLGASCRAVCGEAVVAQLEPTSFTPSSPQAEADEGAEQELLATLAPMTSSSSESGSCPLTEGYTNRALDERHSTVDVEGELPVGWELWMVPPGEWCGDEATQMCVPGSLRMDVDPALHIEAAQTEVVLSRVFQIQGDMSALGDGQQMMLSAGFRFSSTSDDDGWLAIGLRPLSEHDDTTMWNPRHPRDGRIRWVNVTPATLPTLLESGDVRELATDRGAPWYRLDLGRSFAPPLGRSFVVYLKAGARPASDGPVDVEIDEIELTLGSPATPGSDDMTEDERCDPEGIGHDTLEDLLRALADPELDEERLAPGDAIRAAICEGDEDWYVVDAGSAEETAEVSLQFENARGDLDLRAYALDGVELAVSDGVEDEERLEASGIFILRVYGYRDAAAPYSLVIR